MRFHVGRKLIAYEFSICIKQQNIRIWNYCSCKVKYSKYLIDQKFNQIHIPNFSNVQVQIEIQNFNSNSSFFQ